MGGGGGGVIESDNNFCMLVILYFWKDFEEHVLCLKVPNYCDI